MADKQRKENGRKGASVEKGASNEKAEVPPLPLYLNAELKKGSGSADGGSALGKVMREKEDGGGGRSRQLREIMGEVIDVDADDRCRRSLRGSQAKE